jgi:class 3 adenylate cyclase
MDWRELVLKPLDTPLLRIMRTATRSALPVFTDERMNQLVAELSNTGAAAEWYDTEGRLQWVSDEVMHMLDVDDPSALGIGEHYFSVVGRPVWRQAVSEESFWTSVERSATYFADIPPASTWWNDDERARIRAAQTWPSAPTPYWSSPLELLHTDGSSVQIWCHTVITEHGVLRTYSPGLRASVLALVARGDSGMFEQMVELFEPRSQQCAVLFLDLQGSVQLGRQLPSEAYFTLLASLAHTIDDAIIAEQGIVGKHVGDGAVGFIIDDDPEQCCVRAIRAARAAQAAVAALQERMEHDLGQPISLVLNGALHFSPNLYMGQVVTGGRLEVTALGDEVNECARMLEAATGGMLLASKPLCEYLGSAAESVNIDPSTTVYTQLGQLAISDKARADAGYLPVVNVAVT